LNICYKSVPFVATNQKNHGLSLKLKLHIYRILLYIKEV
jgi:hypothetical protein